MESLSADTIPAGVPEDTADLPCSDAGGFCVFCRVPDTGVFTVPFAAGFVPVLGALFGAVFAAGFVIAFCGACFTAGSGTAASISRRLHSGIWADALQERSRGYSGCLE